MIKNLSGIFTKLKNSLQNKTGAAKSDPDPLRIIHLSRLGDSVSAEAVESEKLAFVILVIAEDARLGDLAALDELGQADEPAKLRFEVELVAFGGNKIDVALAGIQHGEEFCYVNVV